MDAGRGRHRWVRWVLGWLVVVLVGVGTPPVWARVKALPTAAQAVDVGFPRPLAPAVTRAEARVGGVLGDLYTIGRPAPAIILLPGATPAGRDDARAIAAAEAIARAGRTVFVPELALYDRRMDTLDLDRIAEAVLAVPEHRLGQGPPAIVGFSYGGAYGLVAAADPRLEGRLAQVSTFGAYFDLLGVIQAATTGTSIVGGDRLVWDGDPAAGELLTEHALQLAPADEREELAAALEGRRDPAELDEGPRALYALLTHDDPGRTAELAARLPADMRRLLDRFSPAAVAGDIGAPVVAMHAVDDPAVPYAEGLRLVRAMTDARFVTVESFTHVDVTVEAPADVVRATPDVWRLWRFTGWVLSSQEPWWRW